MIDIIRNNGDPILNRMPQHLDYSTPEGREAFEDTIARVQAPHAGVRLSGEKEAAKYLAALSEIRVEATAEPQRDFGETEQYLSRAERSSRLAKHLMNRLVYLYEPKPFDVNEVDELINGLMSVLSSAAVQAGKPMPPKSPIGDFCLRLPDTQRVSIDSLTNTSESNVALKAARRANTRLVGPQYYKPLGLSDPDLEFDSSWSDREPWHHEYPPLPTGAQGMVQFESPSGFHPGFGGTKDYSDDYTVPPQIEYKSLDEIGIESDNKYEIYPRSGHDSHTFEENIHQPGLIKGQTTPDEVDRILATYNVPQPLPDMDDVYRQYINLLQTDADTSSFLAKEEGDEQVEIALQAYEAPRVEGAETSEAPTDEK